MLLKREHVTPEWIEKYKPKVVKAAPATLDNVAADEGRFTQDDYEEFREEQKSWMSEFFFVEDGSEAAKAALAIHKSALS